MKQLNAIALRGLVLDIQAELALLRHLEEEIDYLRAEVDRDPEHARVYWENLALKLHNFYTGCERIFNIVACELNGSPVTGYNRHQRLLDRMAREWDGRRPVISDTTARQLREYLAFRHVVRNIYGFELDPERVERLVARYPVTWQGFQSDVGEFLDWLLQLADHMSDSDQDSR